MSTQDSRQCRSRSNSHLSSTAAHFQGLNIQSSASSTTTTARTTQGESGEPSSSGVHPTSDFRASPSTTYLDPDKGASPEISAPTPQQFTPFPLFTESDWNFYSSSTEEHSDSVPVPLVRVEHQPFGDQRSSKPAAMR